MTEAMDRRLLVARRSKPVKQTVRDMGPRTVKSQEPWTLKSGCDQDLFFL